MIYFQYISGWCFQPLWKIWTSVGMIRNPICGKITLMATKPPTRFSMFMGVFCGSCSFMFDDYFHQQYNVHPPDPKAILPFAPSPKSSPWWNPGHDRCSVGHWISGWCLGHPSEKYERQLGWLFPIYGKIKLMFQTTNQDIYVCFLKCTPNPPNCFVRFSIGTTMVTSGHLILGHQRMALLGAESLAPRRPPLPIWIWGSFDMVGSAQSVVWPHSEHQKRLKAHRLHWLHHENSWNIILST